MPPVENQGSVIFIQVLHTLHLPTKLKILKKLRAAHVKFDSLLLVFLVTAHATAVYRILVCDLLSVPG